MTDQPDSGPKGTSVIFGYVMGLMTIGVISVLFFSFIVYRIGFSDLCDQLKIVMPGKEYKEVLYLPDDILLELTEHNAVIDNAGNPTKRPEHNTIAVIPHKDLSYVLKPNVRLSVSTLKSTKAYNFDPPLLYLQQNQQFQMSDKLINYIKETSRLHYVYSTDKNGHRTTLPIVEADEKILVIGDSVLFGVGVDDEFTVASHLQKIVGNRYEIINAGVGGYDGQQAFLMAEMMSKKRAFSGLIYVACQNDFRKEEEWIEEADRVLTRIKTISHRFDDNVIIVLHTYMEYSLHDIFLEKGWSKKRMAKTDALRRAMPKICERLGFKYCDWTDIVNEFMISENSILSRFALYADHCHLSARGNKLLAQKVYAIME